MERKEEFVRRYVEARGGKDVLSEDEKKALAAVIAENLDQIYSDAVARIGSNSAKEKARLVALVEKAWKPKVDNAKKVAGMDWSKNGKAAFEASMIAYNLLSIANGEQGKYERRIGGATVFTGSDRNFLRTFTIE